MRANLLQNLLSQTMQNWWVLREHVDSKSQSSRSLEINSSRGWYWIDVMNAETYSITTGHQ